MASDDPPESQGARNEIAVLRALIKNDLFAGVRKQEDLEAIFAKAFAAVPKPYALMLCRLLGYHPHNVEKQARAFWVEILAHREELSAKLERPVHLRVAALDLIALGRAPAAFGWPIFVGPRVLKRVLAAIDASDVRDTKPEPTTKADPHTRRSRT